MPEDNYQYWYWYQSHYICIGIGISKFNGMGSALPGIGMDPQQNICFVLDQEHGSKCILSLSDSKI